MSSNNPPRNTTEKIDTTRPTLLARLLAAWEKVPDKTLGELLEMATRTKQGYIPLRMQADGELIGNVERYVIGLSNGKGD